MEEMAIFYQHRGQQPSRQGWGAVLGTSANSWEKTVSAAVAEAYVDTVRGDTVCVDVRL